MTITTLTPEKNSQHLNAVKRLIEASDTEFIPTLSARSSTTQQSLITPAESHKNCDLYFQEICAQNILIAMDSKDNLLGFMSYRENYICEHIAKEFLDNLYVTTVIVDKAARGHAIAGAFYQYLKELYPDHYLFTRTWSSNASHIRILNEQDFIVHKILKDDRGEGIDTVYFKYSPL